MRNVSFPVRQGEVFGIISPRSTWKETRLTVLDRIMELSKDVGGHVMVQQ